MVELVTKSFTYGSDLPLSSSNNSNKYYELKTKRTKGTMLVIFSTILVLSTCFEIVISFPFHPKPIRKINTDVYSIPTTNSNILPFSSSMFSGNKNNRYISTTFCVSGDNFDDYTDNNDEYNNNNKESKRRKKGSGNFFSSPLLSKKQQSQQSNHQQEHRLRSTLKWLSRFKTKFGQINNKNDISCFSSSSSDPTGTTTTINNTKCRYRLVTSATILLFTWFKGLNTNNIYNHYFSIISSNNNNIAHAASSTIQFPSPSITGEPEESYRFSSRSRASLKTTFDYNNEDDIFITNSWYDSPNNLIASAITEPDSSVTDDVTKEFYDLSSGQIYVKRHHIPITPTSSTQHNPDIFSSSFLPSHSNNKQATVGTTAALAAIATTGTGTILALKQKQRHGEKPEQSMKKKSNIEDTILNDFLDGPSSWSKTTNTTIRTTTNNSTISHNKKEEEEIKIDKIIKNKDYNTIQLVRTKKETTSHQSNNNKAKKNNGHVAFSSYIPTATTMLKHDNNDLQIANHVEDRNDDDHTTTMKKKLSKNEKDFFSTKYKNNYNALQKQHKKQQIFDIPYSDEKPIGSSSSTTTATTSIGSNAVSENDSNCDNIIQHDHNNHEKKTLIDRYNGTSTSSIIPIANEYNNNNNFGSSITNVHKETTKVNNKNDAGILSTTSSATTTIAATNVDNIDQLKENVAAAPLPTTVVNATDSVTTGNSSSIIQSSVSRKLSSLSPSYKNTVAAITSSSSGGRNHSVTNGTSTNSPPPAPLVSSSSVSSSSFSPSSFSSLSYSKNLLSSLKQANENEKETIKKNRIENKVKTGSSYNSSVDLLTQVVRDENTNGKDTIIADTAIVIEDNNNNKSSTQEFSNATSIIGSDVNNDINIPYVSKNIKSSEAKSSLFKDEDNKSDPSADSRVKIASSGNEDTKSSSTKNNDNYFATSTSSHSIIELSIDSNNLDSKSNENELENLALNALDALEFVLKLSRDISIITNKITREVTESIENQTQKRNGHIKIKKVMKEKQKIEAKQRALLVTRLKFDSPITKKKKGEAQQKDLLMNRLQIEDKQRKLEEKTKVDLSFFTKEATKESSATNIRGKGKNEDFGEPFLTHITETDTTILKKLEKQEKREVKQIQAGQYATGIFSEAFKEEMEQKASSLSNNSAVQMNTWNRIPTGETVVEAVSDRRRSSGCSSLPFFLSTATRASKQQDHINKKEYTSWAISLYKRNDSVNNINSNTLVQHTQQKETRDGFTEDIPNFVIEPPETPPPPAAPLSTVTRSIFKLSQHVNKMCKEIAYEVQDSIENQTRKRSETIALEKKQKAKQITEAKQRSLLISSLNTNSPALRKAGAEAKQRALLINTLQTKEKEKAKSREVTQKQQQQQQGETFASKIAIRMQRNISSLARTFEEITNKVKQRLEQTSRIEMRPVSTKVRQEASTMPTHLHVDTGAGSTTAATERVCRNENSFFFMSPASTRSFSENSFFFMSPAPTQSSRLLKKEERTVDINMGNEEDKISKFNSRSTRLSAVEGKLFPAKPIIFPSRATYFAELPLAFEESLAKGENDRYGRRVDFTAANRDNEIAKDKPIIDAAEKVLPAIAEAKQRKLLISRLELVDANKSAKEKEDSPRSNAGETTEIEVLATRLEFMKNAKEGAPAVTNAEQSLLVAEAEQRKLFKTNLLDMNTCLVNNAAEAKRSTLLSPEAKQRALLKTRLAWNSNRLKEAAIMKVEKNAMVSAEARVEVKQRKLLISRLDMIDANKLAKGKEDSPDIAEVVKDNQGAETTQRELLTTRLELMKHVKEGTSAVENAEQSILIAEAKQRELLKSRLAEMSAYSNNNVADAKRSTLLSPEAKQRALLETRLAWNSNRVKEATIVNVEKDAMVPAGARVEAKQRKLLISRLNMIDANKLAKGKEDPPEIAEVVKDNQGNTAETARRELLTTRLELMKHAKEGTPAVANAEQSILVTEANQRELLKTRLAWNSNRAKEATIVEVEKKCDDVRGSYN